MKRCAHAAMRRACAYDDTARASSASGTPIHYLVQLAYSVSVKWPS
jgi:hypothetical protein